MHDDNVRVKRSSFVLQEPRRRRITERPRRPARRNQHISASPFVTKSCFYAWGKRSTAGLASDATKWCMKDGWRLSKRQSPTRTSSPCCGPTRRSAASRSRVGGAALSLASPTHYTTPHRAPSSHDLLLGHPHILFTSLITFTP
jgi:hypothetical protein